MNILIVCHAGKGIGLGHLTRSLVVAHSLQQKFGADIRFLVLGESINKDYLSDFDHQFLDINKDLTIKLMELVTSHDIKIIVFDLYPQLIPEKFDELLEELSQDKCKLISIDGLVDYHNYLDLIFIPSCHFNLPDEVKIDIPVIFGWDCYLLNTTHNPIDWKYGNHVLVLTGGSDSTNLGKVLPTLLNEELPEFSELHWVTGPYSDAPCFPKNNRINILNHQGPSNLDNLMLQSNYALTIFGVSFFELLYYGIPTVVFSPYGDKDNAVLNLVESEGLAIVAKDENDAVQKLKLLMEDNNTAKSLSIKARKIMSNPGGQKFSRAVSELIGHV